MRVYAVYIITEGGVPILQEYFQYANAEKKLQDLLFAGGITAVSTMLQENTQEKIIGVFTLSFNTLTYHIRNFENFRIVIVTDTSPALDHIVNVIGMNFAAEFGSKLRKWRGSLSDFQDFKITLQSILKENFELDLQQSINPSKRLDTETIFNLSPELQSIALAIIAKKRLTVEELSIKVNMKIPKLYEQLHTLIDEGFISFLQEEGKDIIYCL